MSLYTLILFSIALSLIYAVCPFRFRYLLLLLGSMAYYATCGIRALPFILITAGSTWAGGLLIESIGERNKSRIAGNKALSRDEKKTLRAKTKRNQGIVCALVLIFNFCILAALKYTDNLLEIFSHLTGSEFSSMGWLLPLGISFYTFQATGYLLDVRNGKMQAERNPLRYLLFISFFPQLIQGPIARYDQLAPQFLVDHPFDADEYERGLLLILWGFFKKKVIADRVYLVVEGIFSNGSVQYGGAAIVIGVLFYSLQQYCDFSGGIDVVTGIARLYGIRLAPNFKRPYFSISLADFWRRWHISLGSWMRDYVFYPFALSRPVTALSRSLKKHGHTQLSRTMPAALGNILVFLLVGIWHGLTANYVLWGLYNGVILAISALLENHYKAFSESHSSLVNSRGFHIIRILRTFLIVNIGWYFDRSETAVQAFSMLAKTVTLPAFWQIEQGVLLSFDVTATSFWILGFATVILFIYSLLEETGHEPIEMILHLPLVPRFAVLLAFSLFVLANFILKGAGTGGFIYAVF